MLLAHETPCRTQYSLRLSFALYPSLAKAIQLVPIKFLPRAVLLVV
jgi:hypothetical protein